ncbi:adenylyl-sulfate kinase [Limnohabitans sp. Jir72]|uniref:adenylyl-sulfate kinase n=1 Tax=Limnohabitans sp. Jir72 TaxID=1977909 RepID=UPI000D39189D|nr:adenylyl-sulfate kinase [Limnohabitans sp. Jir72]PUE35748.1 adenylyl-sulfate kinase [Limnohabitans sp. Jir72]
MNDETRHNRNIQWHRASVTRMHRQVQNGHSSVIVWLTGLSGAGKSTIANAVASQLHNNCCHAYVLDGDNLRHGLNGDLGFSDIDRSENIRRVGEVAKLLIDAGVITIAAFISPFSKDRDRVRAMVGPDDFIEIYCRCPIEVCEQRDVKGLYKKAQSGELRQFTGLTSAYEPPENPDLVLDTDQMDLASTVHQILALLEKKQLVAFLSRG